MDKIDLESEYFTAKQKHFCKEYILDHSGTRAAIAAGYAPESAAQSASRLLTMDKIKNRIAELQQRASKLADLDQQWILEKFKDIHDRCMQAEPVLTKDGTLTGEYKFDSSGANKALDSISKHFGFYEKDNKQSQPVNNISQTKFTLKTKKKKNERD